MLRAFFAVSAAQIIGSAVPVAAPADALRMRGGHGNPSDHLRRCLVRSAVYRAGCACSYRQALPTSQGIYGWTPMPRPSNTGTRAKSKRGLLTASWTLGLDRMLGCAGSSSASSRLICTGHSPFGGPVKQFSEATSLGLVAAVAVALSSLPASGTHHGSPARRAHQARPGGCQRGRATESSGRSAFTTARLKASTAS